MKNIHILQTDKQSRLYLGNNGNFVFGMMQTSIQSRNDDFTNQNVYITSDEEPKAGDYAIATLNGNSEIVQLNQSTCIYYNSKIILTTDQDLIKDGVQAIDDEFLEWFISKANDSGKPIDIVEVHKMCYGALSGFSDAGYKIIIPKEEAKQETLKEVAERYSANELSQLGFINGAKWQQEQDKKLWSDEEVFSLITDLVKNSDFIDFTIEHGISGWDELTKWFEQFKNK